MLRVRLEPFGPDDLPLVEQLMGDPAMTEFLGGPESPEKLADRHRRYAQPGSGMFKIVDEETGEGIGSVGFWEREWQDETVYETGWSVIPAFQGRGVAVEATRKVLELARLTETHRWVHAYPKVENQASNAICRKLGFEFMGAHSFEYPAGNPSRCNDWRYDLTGSG